MSSSTDAADWPYDADRDDPLTALRIPVTSAYPGWRYTACFDRESAARPTDLEAQQLASFIEEYREHWFNDWYKAKLSQRPFDTDAKTVIFHKWAEGDWSYRRDSWEHGPFWVPVWPNLRGGEHDVKNWRAPLTLVQVMDRIHTICDEPMKRWIDWKAAHPEVFAVPALEVPDAG
ncbi:hypothetical protein Sme01_03480 [Sphaerisporangium melleum]|uniref:Uncharacterized protein n=1 Tax=Sphaerisporangium melleum TaxID=321316 RepID=A0A917QPD9_9ACTN|nr:hypothetical protein [Sphaerisporangium melleum]GGK61668.1 hypothetical protein GCM10007964_01030 [Sphaerisporangium melleum]GII67872.1 hypothetical protein Sme01_03480 [Sphaerisporangium melleum]